MAALAVAAAWPAAAQGEPELRVAVKEAPPFAIRDADGAWSGISVELFEKIAARIDRRPVFVETGLDALIDDVAAGRADVGVGALSVTEPREERLDFTHPFFTTGLGIATRTDGGLGWLESLRRFASTGFLKVLATLSLVLFAMGLLVWIFERRRNPEMFGGKPSEGIGSGFWWAAVTMTTVGYGDKAPATLGGRIVALVWMFASLIVISGFTAAIASALTLGGLRSVVGGPEDLPRVEVASVAASSAGAWLRDQGIGFDDSADAAAALDRLRKGEVDAVVYDAPILRYLTRHGGGGDVTVLPRTFDPQRYAFALPEASPLREPINRALLAELDTDEWREIVAHYVGTE